MSEDTPRYEVPEPTLPEDFPIASKLEVRRIQERLRTLGIEETILKRITQDNTIELEEITLEFLAQHHPKELKGSYLRAIKEVCYK